jgi:hypothetical protein
VSALLLVQVKLVAVFRRDMGVDKDMASVPLQTMKSIFVSCSFFFLSHVFERFIIMIEIIATSAAQAAFAL